MRHSKPELSDPWLEHLDIAYDEDRRWITMRRGQLVLACNLGTETVTVPVHGEVVLAWGSPDVSDETTKLAGHSFALLRQD